MNAMSVSPVKSPLNPGSHSVPATATNLTKPQLPPGHNFTPLNLIPEAKPVPPVTITASPEKSVDLCSKPPTSNGTVFPLPEANVPVCPLPATQNCVENSETAENLSTNNTQKASIVEPVLPTQVEPKPTEPKPTIVDDKKPEVAKVHQVSDESASHPPSGKEVAALLETVKDVPNNVDNVPAAKEEDKEPVVKAVDNVLNNIDAKPAPSEPVVESKLEEKTPLEQPIAKELEALTPSQPVESEPQPIVDGTPKNVTPKPVKRKAKPSTETVEDDTVDGRKSKRVRLPTQPYQSPIPELQLIAKLNTPAKITPKNVPERIIAFFKNEFLAVRNPEGSFYICQTFQNIHKSSTKIKIRWFTNLPQDVFTPDFYDTTEFDCILTNVSMLRIEKDRWKLPDHERTRIENILKRALDVEKGVAEQPSVTEEHPDGLDLSLFRDEAQLKKRKKKSKSGSPKKKADAGSAATSPVAAATATPARKKSARAAKSTPKSASKKPTVAPTKKSSRQSAAAAAASQSAAAAAAISEKSAKSADSRAAKREKKKAKGGAAAKAAKKSTAASAKQSSAGADKASSKSWEPSVKASNSSRVVLSLKKESAAAAKSSAVSGAAASAATTNASSATSNSSTAGSEPKATKRTSNVSLKAGAAALATPPPSSKRRKEEPKATTAATATTAAAAAVATTTPAERTGKVRNAGSAVTAKINSAAMRTTKEKERKSTTPTSAAATSSASNQRKK